MRTAGKTTVVVLLGMGTVLAACQPDNNTGDNEDDHAPITSSTGKITQLQVAPESHEDSYDRELYPHWEQVDDSRVPENCDAREARLLLYGEDVEVDDACEATSGTWTGAYTDSQIEDAAQVDMDHLVPLLEAHRSGAWDWNEQRRTEFANDISQLRISTQEANREKGDQDPADWLPPEHQCRYVQDWIDVKVDYGLSADQEEKDALRDVLSRCGDDGR